MKAQLRSMILVISMSCGIPTDDTGDPEVGMPDYGEPGPYAVGTLESSVLGSSEVELTLQVWYPSADPMGEPIRYDELWLGSATEDLVPACAESRPVVVFSHGWGGIRWQSAFFPEHLASHGYVVIAPDHTHNTFLDDDSAEFDNVVIRRPVDVRDSFDWLVAESADPESALSECVDPDAGYAVSGHSFGGYTTFAIAGAEVHDPFGDALLDLGDERAWAALAFAPWDVDGVITTETMGSVFTPVMNLSGRLDRNTTWSQVTSLHEGLDVEPRYLGEFPLAGHSNFAPVACRLFTDEDGCGEEFIDEERFTRLVRTSGLVFLESVRGVEGAIEQLPSTSDDLIWVPY